jgi:hypothetical protein
VAVSKLLTSQQRAPRNNAQRPPNHQGSTQSELNGLFAAEADLAILASWTQLLEKFFAGQIIKYVSGPQRGNLNP